MSTNGHANVSLTIKLRSTLIYRFSTKMIEDFVFGVLI